MENPKTALAERIKQSTNVLVTVSANPSVDQLAAAIGLTLVLNKLGKHATAVFSGDIPSTIEFLQPEQTIEKTTDSLRDFIIALDKSKADKLRYKVEDKLVKIFITPYHTSITEKDLDFSQGDFNVDVVLALGVHQKEDLDQAITAHGRILHDATVASINTQSKSNLGAINWVNERASSLCEMVAELSELLKTGMFDAQIATALLTGIVAETERFSNAKTTSETMSTSAKLMAAGANQQLVATKLQEKPKAQENETTEPAKAANGLAVTDQNGSLDIDHEESTSPIEQIQIDEHGTLHLADENAAHSALHEEPKQDEPTEIKTPSESGPSIILNPPSLGGRLTANSEPESLDPTSDPLSSLPAVETPILSHDAPVSPSLPEPPADQKEKADDTQSIISSENVTTSPQSVAPSLEMPKPETPAPETVDTPDINAARDAVQQAVSSPLEPTEALNAQHIDLGLNHNNSAPEVNPMQQSHLDATAPSPADIDVPSDPGIPPGINPMGAQPPLDNGGMPSSLVPPDQGLPADNTDSSVGNPTAPPVPPPFIPPTYGTQAANDDEQLLPPVL